VVGIVALAEDLLINEEEVSVGAAIQSAAERFGISPAELAKAASDIQPEPESVAVPDPEAATTTPRPSPRQQAAPAETPAETPAATPGGTAAMSSDEFETVIFRIAQGGASLTTEEARRMTKAQRKRARTLIGKMNTGAQ